MSTVNDSLSGGTSRSGDVLLKYFDRVADPPWAVLSGLSPTLAQLIGANDAGNTTPTAEYLGSGSSGAVFAAVVNVELAQRIANSTHL